MTSTEVNERAVMGDNRPPPYDADAVAKLDADASKFIAVAGEWMDLGKIETDDDAQLANDFISGTRKLKTQIDNARKAAKKPHDDAGKAVQAAYTPIITKLERAISKTQVILTPYMEEKERRQREEARKREEEARERAAQAERDRLAAEARNDISAQVDAEEAAKEAERQARQAEKDAAKTAQVGSATGGGRTAALRTIRRARITNIRILFQHYQDHPAVAECLRQLADADIRAKGVNETLIPGIEIIEERKAV